MNDINIHSSESARTATPIQDALERRRESEDMKSRKRERRRRRFI